MASCDSSSELHRETRQGGVGQRRVGGKKAGAVGKPSSWRAVGYAGGQTSRRRLRSIQILELLHSASSLPTHWCCSLGLCVRQVHQGSCALKRGAAGAHAAARCGGAAHFQLRQRGAAGVAVHGCICQRCPAGVGLRPPGSPAGACVRHVCKGALCVLGRGRTAPPTLLAKPARPQYGHYCRAENRQAVQPSTLPACPPECRAQVPCGSCAAQPPPA